MRDFDSSFYRVRKLELIIQRALVGALAGCFIVFIVVAAAYGLFSIIGIAKEILVALITGSVTILSGIFAYILQRNREIELAVMQRERELNLTEYKQNIEIDMMRRKQLQENYARILERIGPYVRNPEMLGDDFTTAHLYTWVVGSPQVVKESSEFIRLRSAEALDRLLLAMRADLKLDTTELQEVSTKSLFPQPSPQGGLN